MTRKILLLMSLCLMTSACSNKDSSGDNLIDAQFIDAPVRGIGYTRASGVSGTTDAKGWFRCIRSEEVIYDLGGIEIGRAACGDYNFIQELLSSLNGWTWQKAAALIQSTALESRDSSNAIEELQVHQTIPTIVELKDNSEITWDNSIYANAGGAFDTQLASTVTDIVTKAPAGPAKDIVRVTLANAETAADTYLGTIYSGSANPVPSDIQAQLPATGVSKVFAIEALKDSVCDNCLPKYWVDFELTTSNNITKATVKKAVGFTDGDITTCSAQDITDGKCEELTLSGSRMISGRKFSALFRTSENNNIFFALSLDLEFSVEGSDILAKGFMRVNKNDSGTDSLIGLYKVNSKAPMPEPEIPLRIFHTSTRYKGNQLGNPDSVCVSDANKPSGTRTFKALLSSSTRQAKPTKMDWVLRANTEYYRASDDQLIGTTDADALFTTPLENSVSPSGSAGRYAHTGFESDWTNAVDRCRDWTVDTYDGSPGSESRTGEISNKTNPKHFGGEYGSCGALYSVICVEQ